MGRGPERHQESGAVETMVASLITARERTGLSTYDIFDRFLTVSEAALTGVRGPEWRQLSAGLEKALPELQRALGTLLYEAMGGYHDVLGPCYSALGRCDSRFGQFFTPWSAARLLAQVVIGDCVRLARKQQIRIFDPACGSGVMLLAIADALHQSLLRRRRVIFAGVDIDPLCVKMTRLNLRLHHLMACTLLVKLPHELTAHERRVLATSISI